MTDSDVDDEDTKSSNKEGDNKYDNEDDKLRTLPKMNSTIEESNYKLISTNNSSYVDNFFSFLSSKLLHEHTVENCIDYYGSFLAVQDKFKMNITDDFEYLHDSNYFLENLNKHFCITKHDFLSQFMSNNSRRNRNKLNISNTDINGELDTIDISDDLEIIELNENETGQLEEVYAKEEKEDSDYTVSEEESDEEEDEEDEEDDEESDDDESTVELNMEVHAYINNFPIQMICLEKCDGLFDSLLEQEELSVDEASTALMQIIMILLIYQKVFHFTHNDLHTNNIMFQKTEKQYLYYRYNQRYYKVPTFGRIFKLIDFGRAIYKFRGEFICSDSYHKDGDAATLYNCEPYMNEKKPRVDPNFSFDLCRLGCSIYDFIIDEEENPDDFNDLQSVVSLW